MLSEIKTAYFKIFYLFMDKQMINYEKDFYYLINIYKISVVSQRY